MQQTHTHAYMWTGLYSVWERRGSLSWSTLVSPAAILAAEWVIDREVSHLLQQIQSQLHSGLYPELSALYLRGDGSLKKVGDTVQQPTLSRTLYKIAELGPDYLYVTMAATLSSGIVMQISTSPSFNIQSYWCRNIYALHWGKLRRHSTIRETIWRGHYCDHLHYTSIFESDLIRNPSSWWYYHNWGHQIVRSEDAWAYKSIFHGTHLHRCVLFISLYFPSFSSIFIILLWIAENNMVHIQ